MTEFRLEWPDLTIQSITRSWALRYQGGKIDFQRCLAIVGRSGAGKSLFARSLAGVLPIGLNATASPTLQQFRELKKPDAIRAGDIVYVPQSPASALPAAVTSKALLQEVISWSVPTDRLTEGPDYHLMRVGLDPVAMGELHAAQLSGGMAQRFAIALALARAPKLLLVDEPTVGLDAANARHIIDLLWSLASTDNLGTIIVTHDRRPAVIADKCLLAERSGTEVRLQMGTAESLS